MQSLLQHKARLRHTALEGIHQQQHAVRHIQHSLNLAPEVTVPRSVDNIDLHALIGHGHILRQNGDTSLPLQIIAIQNQLPEILRLPHQIRLINHAVHERSLTVVDVSNYRDIPNILHILIN